MEMRVAKSQVRVYEPLIDLSADLTFQGLDFAPPEDRSGFKHAGRGLTYHLPATIQGLVKLKQT